MAAMRACVQAMTGSRRPSEGSRRSSNLSATSDSPRIPIRTPSELDIGSPYSAHSNRSYSLSLDDDRTYFSGLPGASSTSTGSTGGTPGHVAAHAGFKQQVLLQRRRSEDERDQAKRRAKRPSMGGRSITFQPDQASPLAFNGYSGAANPQPLNAPRKPSSEFEAGPSTPSSPGSTISIIGGGVLLKSAVAPNSEVAAIREAAIKSQAIPMVLVCEDNVINRRVLSAFLRKKVRPRRSCSTARKLPLTPSSSSLARASLSSRHATARRASTCSRPRARTTLTSSSVRRLVAISCCMSLHLTLPPPPLRSASGRVDAGPRWPLCDARHQVDRVGPTVGSLALGLAADDARPGSARPAAPAGQDPGADGPRDARGQEEGVQQRRRRLPDQTRQPQDARRSLQESVLSVAAILDVDPED
jgi:hypothetical protein